MIVSNLTLPISSMILIILPYFTIAFLILLWYSKSYRHPKEFPPGPRLPLPIIGDSYKLGKDLLSGFQSLTARYGQISGFWLGPRRAVVISDFEVLQDILSKPETADRQLRRAMRKNF